MSLWGLAAVANGVIEKLWPTPTDPADPVGLEQALADFEAQQDAWELRADFGALVPLVEDVRNCLYRLLDLETAATTPVADPAMVECPPAPVAGPTFVTYASDVIERALKWHHAWEGTGGRVFCNASYDMVLCEEFADWDQWRDHISLLIAERLESALKQEFPKK